MLRKITLVILLLSVGLLSAIAQDIGNTGIITPVPQNLLPLIEGNGIELLATSGSGRLTKVVWLDNEQFAVTGQAGTWIHNINALDTPFGLISINGAALPSPDGTKLIQNPAEIESNSWASYPYVIMADVETGEINTMPGSSRILKGIERTMWTPSGNVIATSSAKVAIWQPPFTELPTILDHVGDDGLIPMIEGIAISPDERLLVTATRTIHHISVQVWNLENGERFILSKQQMIPGQQYPLQTPQFSEDGREVALMTFPGTVRFWDTETLEELPTHGFACLSDEDESTEYYQQYLISVDLVAGYYSCISVDRYREQKFRIFHFDTGTITVESDLNARNLVADVSSDGVFLAVTGISESPADNPNSAIQSKVQVWDMQDATLYAEFLGHEDYFTDIAFSPDDSFLVAITQNGIVKLWNMTLQEEQATFKYGHESAINDLAISPSGQFLVSTATRRIRTRRGDLQFVGDVYKWNLKTGSHERLLSGEEADISSVVYSPDGEFVLLGGQNGKVHLLDAETFEEVRVLPNQDPVNSLAFSSDGHLLAVATQRNIRIWDMDTYSAINILHNINSAVHHSVDFSPDNNWLMLGDSIWKVENQGQLIAIWDAEQLEPQVHQWFMVNRMGLARKINAELGMVIVGSRPISPLVQLADLNTGEIQWSRGEIGLSQGTTAVAIGDYLIAIGDIDGVIRIFGIPPRE